MSLYIDNACRRLGYRNYNDYLNSENWKVFSNHIKENRKRCFCCNCKEDLSIHHINYKNLGYELPKDVVVLCRNCHFKVHKLSGSGESLLRDAHLKLRDILNPPKKKKSKSQKKHEKYMRYIRDLDRKTLSQMPKF